MTFSGKIPSIFSAAPWVGLRPPRMTQPGGRQELGTRAVDGSFVGYKGIEGGFQGTLVIG
jgi:hypothetical protein